VKRRRILAFVAVVLGALGLAGALWAYFTSIGTGTASASVTTLNPPTMTPAPSVSVTTGTGAPTVTVSWTSVTPPASGAVSYYIQRWNGGTPTDACGTTTTSRITTLTCNDTSVPAGTYTFTATAYWASWTARSAQSAPVTVLKTTTTSVASSANPSVVGQTVTYTASVTGSSGTPAGTVAFFDGGNPITCTGGNQTLNGSGQATCQVTYSSVSGSPHSITATYGGQANVFYGSMSSALSQVVNKASPSIATTLSASSITAGGTVNDTSTLTGLVNSTGTGTVTYSYYTNNTCTAGGVTVNTVTVPTSGIVPNSSTVIFSSAGTFYWQAVYSGDANNLGASSPCTSVNNEQLTVTASGPTYNGTGPAVSYVGNATQAVPYPNSPANAGDLLLLVFMNNDNRALHPPGGWTQLADVVQSGTKPNYELTVWWKLATAGETSVNFNGDSNGTGGTAWVVRYNGPVTGTASAVVSGLKTSQTGTNDGQLTSGSTSATSSLFTSAMVGWGITDSKGDIPAGTTITAAGAGTATLSQAATGTTSNDIFTVTPNRLTPTPDVTTTHSNATVISIPAVRATNPLSLSTPQGFTFRNTATNTPGTAGDAIGVADQSVGTSGTTPPSPTWSQSGFPAQWAWVTAAFY
jgi:hypothetical protein